MSDSHWCWFFEAGSIQSFIGETGRLADAVGASLLVDRLTGDLLDESTDDLLSVVLKTVGASDHVRFSRRGGGAFVAFFDDETLLGRSRALWQAALHVNAPGLRWGDGVARGPSEREAAAAARDRCQRSARQDAAHLPEAGPLVLRVARTGQPAVERARLGRRGLEAIDAATVARRRHSETESGRRSLTDRFSADPSLIWPRNMDDDEHDGQKLSQRAKAELFPFEGGPHDIAFIHADGNGLGAVLRKLEDLPPNEYVNKLNQFSRAISSATRYAAACATEQALVPFARDNGDGTRTMPARPLVLGGDDLSIIVRADRALPFAEAFLRAFQEGAAEKVGCVSIGDRALPGLTAACGIVVIKATYPFSTAMELAEALCTRAKEVIKVEQHERERAAPLSALTLQRVTTALAEEELPAIEWANESYQLGHRAYVLRPPKGAPETRLPCWEDLCDLTSELRAATAPRGPARKLLIDLKQDIGVARRNYRRWRDLRDRTQLQTIDDLLKKLGADRNPELPLGNQGTPWPDALLVAELSSRGDQLAEEPDA